MAHIMHGFILCQGQYIVLGNLMSVLSVSSFEADVDLIAFAGQLQTSTPNLSNLSKPLGVTLGFGSQIPM